MNDNKTIHMSKLKITIIIIDIIVVVGLLCTYLINSKKETTPSVPEASNKEITKETDTEIKFKEITYSIPKNMEFMKNDNESDKFVLTTDEFTVQIEPFIDITSGMEEIIKNHYQENKKQYSNDTIDISGHKVLKYSSPEEKKTLYYVSMKFPFVYEIEYADSKKENLEEIIAILDKAQYNQDTNTNYTYNSIKVFKSEQ